MSITYPSQLSGGQVQSAAIARALVNDPDIIIADEPTGNLDSASSRLVMELLSEIHKTGRTILFVTHNPELTRYATSVVYMHDGGIIHDELTSLGEVAATASKVMYSIPETTEEDDLAGVSIIMNTMAEHKLEAPKKVETAKKKLGQEVQEEELVMGGHGDIKMALVSLRGARWRSTLTMLGIVFGVVSVVTVVGIGDGVKQQIGQQANQFGKDLITIRPGRDVTSSNPLVRSRILICYLVWIRLVA